MSLLCALDRSIKDKYGLDEREIGILSELSAVPPIIDQPDDILAILYDATGRGNVQLDTFVRQPNDVLKFAYDRINACHCRNGCYLCLKSYNTQVYAQHLSKDHAKMFVGYLLGKNVFQPALPSTNRQPAARSSMVLTIRQENRLITVCAEGSQNKYTDSYEDDGDGKNTTVFGLLVKAIRAEYHTSMSVVIIRSKDDYVVNALNGKWKIKTGRSEFARLRFELLRFKKVVAEKG